MKQTANTMQPNSKQHTLAHAVTCEGIGLHCGVMVTMVLKPAEENAGITFVRTDVAADKAVIPAQYDLVSDTRLGTSLVNEHGTAVSTIEHLMAALWGAGVDNVTIELNAPEVPIMDGSSEPFLFLIEGVGLREQSAPRRVIRVLKTVTVSNGDSMLTLHPHDGFAMDVTIDFAHKAIAKQQASYDFSRMTFGHMLSRARTFGFAHEVEQLRKLGLARGGSLDNAIVIGEEGVLNREGLRYNDEFVRHKALDCIGDLFLAGGMLLARVDTTRPGHGINNQALRALMADDTAWEWSTANAHEMPLSGNATTGAGVGSAMGRVLCK